MKSLLFSLITICSAANAQLTKVCYQFKNTKETFKRSYNETYILHIKDTNNIFYSQDQLRFDSAIASGTNIPMVPNEEVIISSKKQMLVYNQIYRTFYVYCDSAINNINWRILNDTLTILGFKCNSATAFFRGKQWTAWYAPKISCKYGPWILNGLPGIILKASADSNTMVFEAIGFKHGSSLYPDINELKKTAKPTNHITFFKERNFFNNNANLFVQNDPVFKDLKKADGTPLFEYKGEKKVKLPTYFEE